MSDAYNLQIGEFKKLSFIFFERLALGSEPLTYTFSETKDTKEVQVEISARHLKKAAGILVTFDFCPGKSTWMHTSDASATYLVSPDGLWQESSYDGSE